MHLEQMLHKLLNNVMHSKRLDTLTHMVRSALIAGDIRLTSLGRGIDLPIQERSGIRKADRFLGNEKILGEIPCIYREVGRYIIGSKQRPLIIVDWSKLPHSEYQVLRASLVASGRALVVYEEMHHGRNEGNAGVHRRFLQQLYKYLPNKCRPIMVTDAGFQNPWFKEVLTLGWDYVGRVRGSGKKTYRLLEEGAWCSVQELFAQATVKPMRVGAIELAKTNPLKTTAYVVKPRSKGRHATTQSGERRKGRIHKEKAKSAYEPLLLVSSLPKQHGIEKKVMTIYKKRMQIEESFRDMKSVKYGFGFRSVKTRRPMRLQVYLLIVFLATLWAWLVGKIAESHNIHRQFQANSTQSKRVLSLVKLGCRVIKKKFKIPIDFDSINCALEQIGQLEYV